MECRNEGKVGTGRRERRKRGGVEKDEKLKRSERWNAEMMEKAEKKERKTRKTRRWRRGRGRDERSSGVEEDKMGREKRRNRGR